MGDSELAMIATTKVSTVSSEHHQAFMNAFGDLTNMMNLCEKYNVINALMKVLPADYKTFTSDVTALAVGMSTAQKCEAITTLSNQYQYAQSRAAVHAPNE